MKLVHTFNTLKHHIVLNAMILAWRIRGISSYQLKLVILYQDGINLNKKSVIIITHHFPPEATGGASRIYEMAQTLKDAYNVTILCPPPTFPFTKYKKARYVYNKEYQNGLQIIRFWTFQPSKNKPSIGQRILYYGIFPILASFYLLTHLKDVSFILISIPPSPLLITSLVARLFKKKLLTDVRDLWADVAVSLSYIKENSLMLKLVRKFENYCLEKSDLIITNSRTVYENLNSKLKVSNKNKLKYFPFSVNLESFKKINGITRKRQIVYIGNLGTAQNLRALIEAFPTVLRKVPDLKITFYGGGDCEQELKELVRELNIQRNVEFNNPVPRDEIPEILSRSMLGIVALSSNKSVRYALPTKSFEYLASGLPIVAYGSSDEVERVLRESQGGIYVKGDDKKQIGEAIVKIVNDKDAFETYSINGRKFAETNTFHSLISDLHTLLEEK
jgi:colanic acid biosynthesis glycosyl transferase WcaI